MNTEQDTFFAQQALATLFSVQSNCLKTAGIFAFWGQNINTYSKYMPSASSI